MFVIIGGGLWLVGGFLFISRICRFDAPKDDSHQLADHSFPWISAGNCSLPSRDAVPAVDPIPTAATLVLIKDGLNEPPRASSLRFHGRIIGDD